MSELSKSKKWIVPIHIIFWLTFLGLMIFVYGRFLKSEGAMAATIAVNLAGQMVLVYGNLLYLIPRYFYKQKYVIYVLLLSVLLFITTLIRFVLGKELIQVVIQDEALFFTPGFFGGLALSGLFLLILSVPLILIENYFKKIELEVALRTQQLEAELKYLKAQVNPHFLFNALNNIYALSFTKSDQAPEMILKLSEMMSYMLYDCKAPKVKLSSEVAYLKNYIDLFQLKKDGELNISFECTYFDNVLITPMLFIPFFENAFKHGNIEDVQRGWIKSKLSVLNKTLNFGIENTLPDNKNEYTKGGIGLANVEERLALLYPQKHQLEITDDHETFKVNLEIDLS